MSGPVQRGDGHWKAKKERKKIFELHIKYIKTSRPDFDQNANRNPNRNQETTVSWLFSNFQLKRDLEQYFHDSDKDFVFHSDDHFESHLPRNRLYSLLGPKRLIGCSPSA